MKRCLLFIVLCVSLAVASCGGGGVAATQAPSVPEESSSLVESVEEVEVEVEEEPVSYTHLTLPTN